MSYDELRPVIERLDEIRNTLDKKYLNRYLSLNKVSQLTSLSISTIRRAIHKGSLKSSKRTGKILCLESDIRKWISG